MHEKDLYIILLAMRNRRRLLMEHYSKSSHSKSLTMSIEEELEKHDEALDAINHYYPNVEDMNVHKEICADRGISWRIR